MSPLKMLAKYRAVAVFMLVGIAAFIAIILYFLGQEQLNDWILPIFLTIGILSCVAAILTYRQLTVLSRLTRDASRLAEGDFNVAEIPIDSKDDLGQLSVALDQMRNQLHGTTLSRQRLDRILGAIGDAIILTDPDETIIRVNEAATKLFGRPKNKLIGMPIRSFVAVADRDSFTLVNEKWPLETVFVSSTETEIPISYTSSNIDADDLDFSGFIITARNIAESKMTEKRIRYLARIDALTRVPNRMQFQHLLQRSIARSRRSRKELALLYLDVDRFKDINDTFGHSAGDACLEAVADRLASILPDGAIIGRLAGDEFGVVLELDEPNDNIPAYLQSILKLILTELSRLLIVQGHEIYMAISIGVARYPKDADNVIDLIRNADAALYHTKRAGGHNFEFFDPEMNALAAERLMLKSKLRRSYELDELLMHYQPKISLATGEIVGAEALVRWELSERGLVLPSEFIPLAEETNLIVQIGEWVLNKVCSDVSQWQREIASLGHISVNLSLKQLRQPNFSAHIQAIFQQHGILPSSFELEITETTLMRDAESTVEILQELHELGLNLSIDDFGTGYSSLSALQQFPIGTLKIDKSFIRDMTASKDAATIVSTIIDMAHSMNMYVVAEGVESELQLDLLKILNCDFAQGLLFGQPMAAADYFNLLRMEQEGRASRSPLFG
jgi:diguanylate cyclase (GGDEF)-like protein/PAS domain S-box-containing protein